MLVLGSGLKTTEEEKPKEEKFSQFCPLLEQNSRCVYGIFAACKHSHLMKTKCCSMFHRTCVFFIKRHKYS